MSTHSKLSANGQNVHDAPHLYKLQHITLSSHHHNITQNFIMARFPAFERNKVHQILKIASISPERLT